MHFGRYLGLSWLHFGSYSFAICDLMAITMKVSREEDTPNTTPRRLNSTKTNQSNFYRPTTETHFFVKCISENGRKHCHSFHRFSNFKAQLFSPGTARNLPLGSRIRAAPQAPQHFTFSTFPFPNLVLHLSHFFLALHLLHFTFLKVCSFCTSPFAFHLLHFTFSTSP